MSKVRKGALFVLKDIRISFELINVYKVKTKKDYYKGSQAVNVRDMKLTRSFFARSSDPNHTLIRSPLRTKLKFNINTCNI